MGPTKKILVVCEGPTDFVIIKGIIKYITATSPTPFEIQMLSPQIDATTRQPERQGWTGVKNWCRLNAIKDASSMRGLDEKIKQAALRRNWESLLLISGSDLLLVHLDTDIAEEIDKRFDSTKETRRILCERYLNIWLGIKSAKPKCKYLLPTYATETWILATYDSKEVPTLFSTTPTDYEIFDDYEGKLISIGYASRLRNSKRRLIKKPRKYEVNDKYLPRLLGQLSTAASRCNELSRFIALVESI
jgi:hypothetical protein